MEKCVFKRRARLRSSPMYLVYRDLSRDDCILDQIIYKITWVMGLKAFNSVE